MFRHRILADENANIDALVDDLRTRLERAHVSPPGRALAVTEAAHVLRQFVDSGRKLASFGSQFQAARDINGEGYSIKIDFGPRAAKGWLAKLLGR